MVSPAQLPKPQLSQPIEGPTVVKPELPAETWWDRKIRSHPLFSGRSVKTTPSLPPVDQNPELNEPFRLSTGWLVATSVVCLIGIALVLLAYFSAN